MQTVIWKFLALSGVIGLGCFVVYQVHTRIPIDGKPSISPSDFSAPGPEATAVTTDLGSPGDGAGLVDLQSEPDSASDDSAPDWDEVPVQTEPAPMLAADATVPALDAFWSDVPGSSAEDTSEPVGVSHSATAEAPWSSIEQTNPTGTEVDARDFDRGPLDVGPATSQESGDAAAPRPLPLPDELRPLSGASSPNAGWSDEDSPDSDAAAPTLVDADVVPVEGLNASLPGNPFSAEFEVTDDAQSDGEREELPLVDFGPEVEPDDNSADATVDPFSGFPAERAAEAVTPDDPRDAGFVETTPPLALPPRVASNPFATAPPEDAPLEEDAAADDSAEPAVSSEPRVEEPPGLPAFTRDPYGDVMPVGDGPELSTEPDATPPGHVEGPAAATVPRPRTALGPDIHTHQNSPLAEDDENVGPAFGQVEPLPLHSGSGSRVTSEESAETLDLVGDATITGDRASGPQQPELEIEKFAPPEATVGEPLIYAIHIRNVGRNAAHGVVVEDRIPRGTTLEGTIPQAELADKVLTWRMGTIDPGQEATIRIKVVPTEAGEIGSVATVRFAAEVAAATNITAANLQLEIEGPEEIALGETAEFRYRLTNSGNGTARGAYIRCVLPAALEHPGGADIDCDVGDLPPGASREVDLTVHAIEAGTFLGRALLNAGGRTHDESEFRVHVLPSRLLISREGPARRFVGRPADYTTVVTNRSSNALTGITVIEQLPEALELASIPESGQYDPVNRTITWTIPRLPAGESFTVYSSIVARQYGLHSSSITARDQAGNSARVAAELQAAGFSTIEVDWEQQGGPVAVGEQVALRLTVRNQGTAPAENVEAVFEVPPQMEFVNADGPVSFQQEGRVIRFRHLDELAIDDELSYDIVLTAAAPGSTKVSAQLRTADHAEPLRHDEPVLILDDND